MTVPDFGNELSSSSGGDQNMERRWRSLPDRVPVKGKTLSRDGTPWKQNTLRGMGEGMKYPDIVVSL